MKDLAKKVLVTQFRLDSGQLLVTASVGLLRVEATVEPGDGEKVCAVLGQALGHERITLFLGADPISEAWRLTR